MGKIFEKYAFSTMGRIKTNIIIIINYNINNTIYPDINGFNF